MSSYLIIGLPRSGTTILNALLNEQFSGWNLNEEWRINETDKDISNLKNDLPTLNREQQIRLNYLKDNTDRNWILKIWPDHFLLQKKIMDEVLRSDVKVLMTNRKNLEEHFNSWLNAIYRVNVFNMKSYEQFNINSIKHAIEYDVMDISERNLISFFDHFRNSLIQWRMVYEYCKDRATVVSYEDEIKLLNLNSVGITKETIDRYHQKEMHFVPTPFNSKNVLQKDVYSQCVQLLKNYNYLVEV